MNRPLDDPPPFAADRKIDGRHRDRMAVVYVRQSTVHQVQHNRESTQLQYGLVDRAVSLGWPRERVVVIDDDLGLSGSSADGRQGFQRLLGEVALDHVGLILGVEMSRLARSCKDWYQLLELCALFGTLICDLDGLYDPSSYNDRLLLGLKGTMSEAELHILRQRMHQGAMQKARRGELVSKVPIGYMRTPAGEVTLDPDEQARSVVRLIFEQFGRIGTASGLPRWLVDHEIQMPVRDDGGPEKGRLRWRRPCSATVRNILTHPMYAGAYVYGRSCQAKRQPRRDRPRRLPRDQWQVLLRDRYPAYIDWDQYESNVARLAANRSRGDSPGAVRRGRALLTGLVVCGRCGSRMMTRYAGKSSLPRYGCEAARANHGGPRCQGLAAAALDEEVVRLALAALGPAALEVSLRVAADLQCQFDLAEGQWLQKLERARFEADRARRQYEAVEPENRLVARTLEQAWERGLRVHRDLVEQHERFLRQEPRLLGADEQECIRRLAIDLPALWEASSTTDADRKEVLRQVIEEVVVTVEGDTEWVEAKVRWAGGRRTSTRLRRPVARLEQLGGASTLRRRVEELKAAGTSSRRIAEVLEREGLRATDGRPFTAEGVRGLLSRYGLSRARGGPEALGEGEWLIPALAGHLGIASGTIYSWIRRGVVSSRRGAGTGGRVVVTGIKDVNNIGCRSKNGAKAEVRDGRTT